MTDTACFNLDAHLTPCGFWHGAIDDFEIAAWFADLNSFIGPLYRLWMGCELKVGGISEQRNS